VATAPPSPAVFRRRRLVALGVLLLIVAGVVALLSRSGGDEPATKASAKQAAPKPKLAELPRGGRRLLPDRRIVAYYGAPQDDELGALGIGTPAHAARRLERQAKPYATKARPVLPAMELIAVTAAAHPGEGERYNTRQDAAIIDRYHRAARKAKALLILDIQPGRSDFFTEATRLKRWLKAPDVGLALDPEWRMDPGQVPGQVIGHVESREVNAVSAWLSKLTVQRKLPQKLFLIHQFTNDMVDDTQLKERAGLAMVLNADGFGTRPLKKAKYKSFTSSPRRFFGEGFKLFYREDTNLMTPRQVLRLKPPPDVVVYE
jgi:hypothetical protein